MTNKRLELHPETQKEVNNVALGLHLYLVSFSKIQLNGIIFHIKISKPTIFLLYIFSCVLTLSQMFAAILKLREICNFTQGNLAFPFVVSR